MCFLYFIGKKNKAANVDYAPREQDNSEFINLGSWGPGEWKQTADYSIPIQQQFPNNVFPEGQFMDHPHDFNTRRISGPEFREKDKICES